MIGVELGIGCSCIPHWISHLGGPRTNYPICLHCRRQLDGEEPLEYDCCIIIPCSLSREEPLVHVIPLIFHVRCLNNWLESWNKQIYSKLCLVVRLPSCPDIKRPIIDKLAAECIRKHTWINVFCSHCATQSQQGCKMAACSRCNKTVYCSKECQVADWPRHRAKCKG